MRRDVLKENGLTDEQIDFVMAENGKDVNALNDKVNGLTSERDGLQKQITERDSQLDGLKKTTKDNDDLQAQIKQLQDDNKVTKQQYQDQLAAQSKSFKIEGALRDAKAKNIKAVLSLIDTDKIEVAKDGSLSGLTDQLDAVKKSDGYLFDTNKPQNRINIGGQFSNDDNTETGKDHITSHIAARFAKSGD